MNRQSNQQISQNSSQNLFYSQYLKQQQISPRSELNNDNEFQELKKKCEMLTKQLEIKEQIISEMRAYQKLVIKKIPDQQIQDQVNFIERIQELDLLMKEKETEIQNLNQEKSIITQENLNLKQELERITLNLKETTRIQKFVNSIIDLVIQCHPQNHFENQKPDLKECWKWLKKILYEYMQLKKQQS